VANPEVLLHSYVAITAPARESPAASEPDYRYKAYLDLRAMVLMEIRLGEEERRGFLGNSIVSMALVSRYLCNAVMWLSCGAIAAHPAGERRTCNPFDIDIR
jgi:hypothetical protein